MLQRAPETRPKTAPLKGEKEASKPAAGEMPEQSKGDASDAYAEFDGVFTAYAGKFAFLAQKQQAAINSLYTEAKKPEKPGILDDLLVSLAMAGLGMVGSVLAQNLERTAEKSLIKTLNVADPSMHENEALRSSIQRARDNVKIMAKSAGDAFKAGTNQFVGPKIRDYLAHGKSAVEAFYEGQIDGVIDVGASVAEDAAKRKASIWDLHHIHPAFPKIFAQGLLDSANKTFAEAEVMQRRETLTQWLAYEAQATQSSDGKSGGKNGTDLSAEGWESNTKGVLRVLAHVDGGRGEPWRLESDRGNILGVTENMLKTLSGPIDQLHIPIVYIVSSWELMGGRGVVDDGLGTRNPKQTFQISVNEKGVRLESKRYSWQDEALLAVGGVEKVLGQLGKLELDKLPGIAADQG